jgi:hypothetical protein
MAASCSLVVNHRRLPRSARYLIPLLLTLLTDSTTGQLNIDVKIEGTASTTVNTQTFSSQLVSNGLSQGSITTDSSSILLVDKCPKGTFGAKDGASCIDCPAGTASPVEGAANPMTCSACSTGSFSSTASSVCTDCTINTFSTTYMASNQTQCLTCPPHTTSPTHSNQVEDCVCDSGYFMSDNIIRPFDTILASLGFEGAISINIPHVVC